LPEPARPSIALVFGSITPPQSDVVELFAHLGCSKEVSSFEVKLHNHDGKYSPGGSSAIAVGTDGSISLGRGAACPLLMTLRVEKVHYQSSPIESYLTVSGRCWGERLFRRTVTADYTGLKGEEIVKNLMDYYAGLSHNRSGTELVEATDTTYTELKYEDSPVWDILKYVAESADKAGVIGYDFRVAPDGKFEFFPKLSKTNSTVITENIDTAAEYEKDITRVRNKIIVWGLADKSLPSNKVAWTRSLTTSEGTWTASAGSVSVDATGAPDGGACIKLYAPNNYYGSANFTLNAGNLLDCEKYPILAAMLKAENTFSGTGQITLYDNNYKTASKELSVSPDGSWHNFETGVGSAYKNQWNWVQDGFDWTKILVVRITFYYPGVGTGSFWIHQLYIGGRRYRGIAENAASQAAYGLREYVEVDEELWSDEECNRRAAALLAHLKDPAEHLHIVSTVLDYGLSPILGGDKVHVQLPVEGVNGQFRVEWAEYRVPKEDPTKLEITLDLGKEPPHLADYLYGLRTHTPNVEKLSRTKIGKRGVPVSSGGGGGGGTASSYFNSNVEIDKTAPVLNLLTGRNHKSALGFDGANTFLTTYIGDLILNAAATGIIRPVTDGSDQLGNGTFRFKEGHFKDKIFVAGWEVIGDDGRVKMWSMPRDTSGYVLEAQGPTNYPMYVNPNGRYVPAAHTHESIVRGTKHVELDPNYAVANFYDGANLKGAIGHDGANFFAVAYAGDLIIYSANALIRPETDGGADLGTTSSAKRFGSLHLKNDLWVAGYQVVDTNGKISFYAFPRDTAGYVIEAQGAGYNPMYVNPNGRYSPAAHDSGHANLYPSGGSNSGQVGNTSNYWNVIATNSMWYKAVGTFGCDPALAGKEITRSIQSRSQAEEVLTHETTKTWRHMPYARSKKHKGKIICTCGRAMAEPCPEHRKAWEDRYIVNTGAQLEAAAYLVLELSADVRRLETELAALKEEMTKGR